MKNITLLFAAVMLLASHKNNGQEADFGAGVQSNSLITFAKVAFKQNNANPLKTLSATQENPSMTKELAGTKKQQAKSNGTSEVQSAFTPHSPSIKVISVSSCCAGFNVSVTFIVKNGVGNSEKFKNNSVYTLYLSNSAGSNFTSQGQTFSITANYATASNGETTLSYNYLLPSNTSGGTGYKIAIGSSNPAVNATTGAGASSNFTIFTPVAPSTPTPSNTTICKGSSNTTYTASASSATSYIWSVTGIGNTISGTGTTGTVTWNASFTGTATVSVVANGCGITSPSSTTVKVNPINTIALSSAAATNAQSLCNPLDFVTITYATTTATGATFTGLPAGLTGNWSSNVATISGTPTVNGSFNYTVKLTGGCGNVSSTGNLSTYTTTWTVTNNIGSWSNGVPSASVGAVISGNYAENVDLTACSLLVNNNAIVAVVAGKDFNITKAVKVQNGSSLTVENNANLLQSGTTNLNTGEITAKRINSSMRRLDYTYWSSPTAKATYSLKNFSPETVSPPIGASRFYSLSESNNAFVALDPLATYFDSSNIAKGFCIRAPNNFPTNSATSTFNADFMGVPNSGNITIAVANSSSLKGSNLIGNPYPSAINALAFLNYSPNGITKPNAGTIYFWTHNTQGAASSNYASFNLSGGTASILGGSTPNGVIQVGQGFVVKKAASSTVVFNNSMRVGNNLGQFFKTTTTEKHRIWLNLAKGTTPLSQMMVGYIEGTTLGFDDSYDGKLINLGSTISSIIDSENFVIQARPTPFVTTDEVPLNFKADDAGSYTLSIDHLDGLFLGDQNVYLKDNLLNITHDIKKSVYTFVSDQGTFADRFDLVYNNATLTISKPTFNDNSVIVYKNDNNVLNINCGKVIMKNIKIYDVLGRLIYEQSNINTTKAALSDLKAKQEVLLVKITSDDNKVVTKKVVY